MILVQSIMVCLLPSCLHTSLCVFNDLLVTHSDCQWSVVQSGIKQSHGVELTSLSYIPGARIDHYPGHLNFFIIRETTSVREVD